MKPGYKQTEVGVIPEDWEVRPLAEFCVADWGNTTITKSSYVDAGFQAFSASGPDGCVSWFEHDQPAIVISAIGAQCGKTWIARGRWTPIKNTIWFRSNEAIANLEFVFWVTNNPDYWPKSGQAQPFVAVRGVRNARVALPSVMEQRAIAEALSDADALIESLEALVAKKRQIKQGAMQELLTGKRRLPGFSGEWETKAIGDMFALSGGMPVPRSELSVDGIPYLHYGDIHTSSETHAWIERTATRLDVRLSDVPTSALLRHGDVAFVDASEDVEGASRHFVVLSKDPDAVMISGLHTSVAKPRGDSLDVMYLRYCFQTEKVREHFRFYAVGTKVSGVSRGNLGKIHFLVPSLAEQRAIAAVLSDLDSELEALETKLHKARTIKQGMMQELLTGRTRLVAVEAS